MWTPKHQFMGFTSVVGLFALMLLFAPFDSAQSAKGSSSGKVVGIGSVGTGIGKCDVPPTWKGEIRGKKRWVPTYFDKHGKPHAYCDRQTGIVIQGTPGTPIQSGVGGSCDNGATCTWDEARFYCANLTVGDSGQKGWRLMYMPELTALVDINSKSCTEDNLCLPDGHPFKGVQTNTYWAASTHANTPGAAWVVNFANGLVGTDSKDGFLRAWCGRGESAAVAY